MPSPSPDPLAHALRKLPQGPLCIGYSGGLDSTVLLQALADLLAARQCGLRACHVHHGLHPQADDWAAHCQANCDRLGLPLTVSRVPVKSAGEGLEAAARSARRTAFAAGLGDGETLVLAHHLDDQAETFLLRALRASGPDGLGAMRVWCEFGRGRLWRPLLQVPRDALRAYAAHHRLEWIEDPSNADAGFDRNFLRLQVLPLLRQRWPHAADALADSAALCAQASGLLEDGDAQALAEVAMDDPHLLSRTRLRALPAARRARVLRRWVASLGLPPLPANGVACIESQLLDVRADAEARFAWHGAVVQAWRDVLHAEAERSALPAAWEATWDGLSPILLPTGSTLSLRPNPVGAASAATRRFWAGLRTDRVAAEAAPTGFIVHARRGGERITLPGRRHSHALKQVLQDRAVPPWERARLPLLSTIDGELLAAGDRIISARLHEWLRRHDLQLALQAAPARNRD